MPRDENFPIPWFLLHFVRKKKKRNKRNGKKVVKCKIFNSLLISLSKSIETFFSPSFLWQIFFCSARTSQTTFPQKRVSCSHKAYSPHIIKFNILRLYSLLVMHETHSKNSLLPHLCMMRFSRICEKVFHHIIMSRCVLSKLHAHISARKKNYTIIFLIK